MNFDNWANRSLDTGTQAMFGYLPVLIFVPYLINNSSSSKWQGEEGRIFCYWLWTDVRAQVCSAGLSENTRQGRLDVCGPQRNCSQVANRQMWLTSLFVLSHSIQSIMRGNKYQHFGPWERWATVDRAESILNKVRSWICIHHIVASSINTSLHPGC